MNIKAFLDDLAAELGASVASLLLPIARRVGDIETRAPVPGPQGDRGEPGEKGLQGERGEPGLPGREGADGAVGERGEKGDAGEAGHVGERGERGDQGEPGPAGEHGAPGEPGPTGEKGMDGAPGAQGDRGEKGEAGQDGAAGARGEGGPAGERGLQGDPGLPGIAGKDGAPGPCGEKGDPGEQGRDALAIHPEEGIHAERKYARGTWASHLGGLWRAARDTDALDEAKAADCGWVCMVNGVAKLDFSQADERTVSVNASLSDGKESAHVIKLTHPIDRGVWREENGYKKGDGVSFGGSWFIAQVDDPTDKPEMSEQWRLSVKRGRDGNRAK